MSLAQSGREVQSRFVTNLGHTVIGITLLKRRIHELVHRSVCSIHPARELSTRPDIIGLSPPKLRLEMKQVLLKQSDVRRIQQPLYLNVCALKLSPASVTT